MATYGETLSGDLADAKASLLKLAHAAYDPAQIRDILSSVGTKTEIFLKSVALPGNNPRNTFEWFIDALATAAIDAATRDRLHALRRKYNAAKHDPAISIPLLEATQIVDDTHAAINVLVTNSVGLVGTTVNPHTQRVFWIAVWDHYIHGDSEVHVILPADSEHWLGPPTFDIINVGISDWDTIKTSLSHLGVFKGGEGLIPASQYDAFRTDSDFLGAWLFEGDYRSLITTLAQYELRQDLIAGLNRHENSGSMILAFLLASVDVVGVIQDAKEFATAIIRQATDAYAVPADYQHSQYLAVGLSEMFQLIPQSEWSKISGPVWMDEAGYGRSVATAKAKHAKYEIVIDEDLVVRMLWSHT